MEKIRWDKRFLSLAEHIAGWSKDPSTKVGAVIVDDKNRILGVGYNGFPRGVSDFPCRYNNREDKYMMVVHAEVNAIMNSNSNLDGATLYCTHPPCNHCASVIIQSGIDKVVSYIPDNQFYERFKKAYQVTETMFKESGVHIWLYEKD